jgi:hypothetical protein
MQRTYQNIKEFILGGIIAIIVLILFIGGLTKL